MSQKWGPLHDKGHLDETLFYWNSSYIISSGVADFLERGKLEPDTFAYTYGEFTDGGDLVLQESAAEAIYRELERLRGVFTDVHMFEERFRGELDEEFPHDDDFPALNESGRKHGLATAKDAAVHFLAEFLEHEHMPDVAEGLRTSKTLEEIRAFLAEKGRETPGSLLAEEKALAAAISAAPLEEKSRLSAQLKEIKNALKRRKQIIRGVTEYFSLPQLAVQFFDRKSKELQDFLVRRKRGDQGANLYLDATPDPQFDQDPGAVSGDCTEGRPLPFENPDVPVYNVKVFDEREEHIGNIYLLVTTDAHDESRTVWHFDAIQIPGLIDRKEGLPKLVERIGEEAEKKGISLITVNSDPSAIPNYDYIRDAVEVYCQTRDSAETDIDIPELVSCPRNK